MDYRQQEQFLTKYARIGIGLLAFCVAGTGMLIRLTPGELSVARGTGYGLLTLALAVAVYYVPKYLNLTIETTKRISWTIRIRWILTAILCLAGLLIVRSVLPAVWLAGAIVSLLTTNFFVRRRWKTIAAEAAQTEFHTLIPVVYAAGDSVAVVMLLKGGIVSSEVAVLLAALALHLLILLFTERQMTFIPLVFAGAGAVLWPAGIRGPHLGILALWMTASLALCWIARDHHRRSLEETLASLINFTGEAPEEVEHLLLTSTGTLAANWYAAPPKNMEELENWYRENAGYYLYDLSQFHLAYKHILFSLDVLALARGRVLDYGAGIGDLTLELAAREGFETTYFDVDGESQRYARWRARERGLRVKFVSDRNELEGPYDTIILLDVLEHVADPEETLDFLTARLMPGGRLIASVAFGATKAHPMHFDHKLNVPTWLEAHGLYDAKDWKIRLFGSESMRKKGVIVYQKKWTA
ncbi:MAG: methyltransferase domain-containing protein [Blastocatellia bacterium]|nr:methyltransferase domain-containing protein [Blastocatellia bacterium]